MAGIKSIGILTSGGDAPGMNAAIRAVTRSAIYNGFTVKGIMRGFKGLVFNEIVEFKSQSVSNIIQQGGTILKTARSKEFRTEEGRRPAYENMKAAGIDALVVIGGDGSLSGAQVFADEYDVPIVGLPGTIDNDIACTDLHTVAVFFAHPANRICLPLTVTLGTVDAKHIHACLNQRRDSFFVVTRVDACAYNISLMLVQKFVRIILVRIIVFAENKMRQSLIFVDNRKCVQLVVPKNVIRFTQGDS